MSLFIDTKFIGLVSPRLQLFKRKTEHLFTFRCPICGDSKKNKTKTRGYFYRKGNDMYFRCHNCGVGHTMSTFLKELDPNLQKEYALERYKNGETGHSNYKKPKLAVEEPQAVTKFNKPKFIGDDVECIADLPDAHYAKEYIRNRLIPEERWSELYYTDDFKGLVDRLLPDNPHYLKAKDSRIVIPFYDGTKRLIALQGRALLDDDMRYITIKLENVPKVFGLDKIDYAKQIFLVEGPFDSMFLPNALAAAGSDFPRLEKYKDHVTIVYDNEPRNKEVLRKLEKLVEAGYAICVWPDTVVQKDINAMVLGGMSPDQIVSIIDKNTVTGLSAKIKLNKWRKC